jgi:enterochelin esterase-like enzyme
VVITAAALVAGGLIGLALPFWLNAPGLFGVTLSPVILVASTGTAAGLALVAVNLIRTRWWRKLVAVALAPVILGAGALMINEDVGYYPTLGDALGLNSVSTLQGRSTDAVPLAGWHAPKGLPAHGEVYKAVIPGVASHFHARDAWVYLPPAARTAHPPRLPVVVALSGEPGGPSDLFYGGDIAATMDSIAATHHGVAPIVVVPDQLGGFTNDPMCVDSKLGRSRTYLMTDVRTWIRSNLPVEPARTAWTIAGFSEGGTCSIQLGAAYPQVFGSIVDVSGEVAPLNRTVARTIQVGFHGSRAAYLAASPLHIMGTRRYPDTIAYFAVGALDHKYGPSTTRVSAAARAAGMRVATHLVPGYNHNWNTGALGLTWGLTSLVARWRLPAGSGAVSTAPGPRLPALAPSEKHHLK